MINKILNKRIYQTTVSEKWHIQNKNTLSPFYKSLKTKNYNGKKVYFFDFVNTLKGCNVGMIRETRYTTIPSHLHKDMEMNYVYSGKCTFLINGKRITLKKGDVCILDTDVVNSAEYKNKDDIVFNIIFKKEFFSSIFLSQFNGSDVLSEFLLNAVIGKKSFDNFLIFHTSKIPEFAAVFDMILQEHYFPKANSIHVIEGYCSVLFFFLSRLVGDVSQNLIIDRNDRNVLKILQEIENKDGNCSLNELAEKFHFSASTIYKLLVTATGKNFTQIKIDAQLKKAKFLLTETSMSITDIMLDTGIKNTTFFYDKFLKKFGATPKEYRQKHRSIEI